MVKEGLRGQFFAVLYGGLGLLRTAYAFLSIRNVLPHKKGEDFSGSGYYTASHTGSDNTVDGLSSQVGMAIQTPKVIKDDGSRSGQPERTHLLQRL